MSSSASGAEAHVGPVMMLTRITSQSSSPLPWQAMHKNITNAGASARAVQREAGGEAIIPQIHSTHLHHQTQMRSERLGHQCAARPCDRETDADLKTGDIGSVRGLLECT